MTKILDSHNRHPVEDTMRQKELFEKLGRALSSLSSIKGALNKSKKNIVISNSLEELELERLADERKYICDAFHWLTQIVLDHKSRLKTLEKLVENIGNCVEEMRKEIKEIHKEIK